MKMSVEVMPALTLCNQSCFGIFIKWLSSCHRAYLSHSLFVKKDSNDDTDDKDHCQDRSHHPDQTITWLVWLWVWNWGNHWISVRAGYIHLLWTNRENREKSAKHRAQDTECGATIACFWVSVLEILKVLVVWCRERDHQKVLLWLFFFYHSRQNKMTLKHN